MGTWGTGILQNDTTADIWVEFKELYNKGLSLKEIRVKLEDEYRPQSNTEYYAEIWTGIAYGQWMCGTVEDYTAKKLSHATKLKWQTLWATDKKELNKRLKAISDFIEKIQSPRSKPLNRKKSIDRPAVFKKGDVIALKISEGQYLTGIVVDDNGHPTSGESTIILTDLTFSITPTEQEIRNANVLYLDIGGDFRYHRSFFRAIFSAKNMAKKAKDTIKIGELPIKDYLALGIGTRIGDWNKIGDLYFEQVDFLQQKKSDKPFNVTVSDLLYPTKQLGDDLIEWDRKVFKEQLEWRQKNGK